MKYTIIILTAIITLTGCARNNAFDNFKLNEKQELSINSLQSSKIKSQKNIDGIVSAIYLNQIYPKLFNNNEYFFVYYYSKTDSGNIKLKLNGQLPIKIKKLNSNNRFTSLIKTKNSWNSYYLVAFKKQDKKTINLLLENYPYVSDLLSYQKD